MRKIIFVIVAIVFCNSIIAQENVKTGVITYNNIINSPRGRSFISTWKLYFNNNQSMYVRTDEDKPINTPKDEIRGSTTIKTRIKVLKSKKTPFYFSNLEDKELIFRESVSLDIYTIKDSIETIPWKLHDEFKKIDKYKCQKATAPFRGREYTVWFTTEIPISYGPWKLRGLPGLIIEAKDGTNKYEYKIAAIELGVNPVIIEKNLTIPDDVKEIQPMQVYLDAVKNEYENTMSQARASLPKGARLAEDYGCDECPKRNNRTRELYNQ